MNQPILLPQTDIPVVPVERIPTAEEHFEAAFNSHGIHQESVAEEYKRIRNEALEKIGEELTDPMAEFDVRTFLSTNEARRQAAMKLADQATNPIVSRETQIAILKQLVQDFYRGKKRPGLSALTMLKAVELLNKMCGYDAPEKKEVNVNHKIMTLPIVAEPFKGHLPPLKVVDIGDDSGGVTTLATGESELRPGESEDDLELF